MKKLKAIKTRRAHSSTNTSDKAKESRLITIKRRIKHTQCDAEYDSSLDNTNPNDPCGLRG